MELLLEPARYAPWLKGVYDVSPALKPLGSDFGNGPADRQWFQFDSRLNEFLEAKRRAVAESESKYVRRERFDVTIEQAALNAMMAQLSVDHPGHDFEGQIESIDQLAMQVQEDICVVRSDGQSDWLAYHHVCAPSHWRPTDKIGKPFFDIHAEIPGFEKVNRVAASLVDAMIEKGPFVRFVWGVESDTRPNHHPDVPPGENESNWQGRDFSGGRFWVRSERQVIWGLPGLNAAIFTIRVSHRPDHEILGDSLLRDSLIAALESMSPDSRRYKGLDDDWDNLMTLLKT